MSNVTTHEERMSAAQRVAERLTDALNMVLGEGWEPKVDGMTGGTWRVGAYHADADVLVTMHNTGEDYHFYKATYTPEPRYHGTGATPVEALTEMRRKLRTSIAELETHYAAMGECMPEELR